MEMRGLRHGVPIHTQSKVQTNSGLETAKGKEMISHTSFKQEAAKGEELPCILEAGGGEGKEAV